MLGEYAKLLMMIRIRSRAMGAEFARLMQVQDLNVGNSVLADRAVQGNPTGY